MLEVIDVRERLAQGQRQAVAGGRQARWEHLDERPAEPRGNGLRERGLARPRRAEQHDRTRRNDSVLLGQIGVDEREHDPPLDELLFALHAGQRLPQAARQHAAAEPVEESDLLRLERHDALEVRQVPSLISAVAKGLHAGLALREQGGQAVHAPGHQPLLEFRQHCAAKSLPAPVVREGQQDDPATIAAHASDRRTDDDLADRRHDRDASVARGAEHLGQAVHRAALRTSRLLPDANDLVEIILVEFPNPRRRHALSVSRAGSRAPARRSA